MKPTNITHTQNLLWNLYLLIFFKIVGNLFTSPTISFGKYNPSICIKYHNSDIIKIHKIIDPMKSQTYTFTHLHSYKHSYTLTHLHSYTLTYTLWNLKKCDPQPTTTHNVDTRDPIGSKNKKIICSKSFKNCTLFRFATEKELMHSSIRLLNLHGINGANFINRVILIIWFSLMQECGRIKNGILMREVHLV